MSPDELVSLAPRKDVGVANLIRYTELRWREAILYYLFGIWGNNEGVKKCPKISFGDITLQQGYNGDYFAYGHAEIPEDVPALVENDLVIEPTSERDVEIALVRFVKDNQIMQLRLRLWITQEVPEVSVFVLWKKEKRGQYGVAGLNLPYGWGDRGPIWTKGEFEKQ